MDCAPPPGPFAATRSLATLPAAPDAGVAAAPADGTELAAVGALGPGGEAVRSADATRAWAGEDGAIGVDPAADVDAGAVEVVGVDGVAVDGAGDGAPAPGEVAAILSPDERGAASGGPAGAAGSAEGGAPGGLAGG